MHPVMALTLNSSISKILFYIVYSFPTKSSDSVSKKKTKSFSTIMLPLKTTHLIIFSMLLFISCNSDSVSPAEENAPNLRALSVGEQKLVASSNDFAFELFKEINKSEEDKNLMISPLSVSAALAMTYNGAAGNTKEEIKNTLGFEGIQDDELNQAFKDLQSLLLNMDKKTTFNIANSIWYRDTYTLQDGFSSIIKDHYDGEIRPLDFTNPGSNDIINDWVEDKTENKIRDLVGEISSDQVMFLINAIYFKATWKYRFKESNTAPQPFYLADGSVVQREAMYSDQLRSLYAVDEDFQYISLPYGNEQFYMSIILPHADRSIDEIINQMDAAKISSLVERADTSSAPLYLPKFKLEYKKVLNEPLQALGINDAFVNADFSGFFADAGQLNVSEVNHKTFIEVDEEGTEAAAATSVGVFTRASSSTASQPIIINRPFVFLIMEKSSQNILFVGKIMDPEG